VLEKETQNALADILPAGIPCANPVNVRGDAPPELLAAVNEQRAALGEPFPGGGGKLVRIALEVTWAVHAGVTDPVMTLELTEGRVIEAVAWPSGERRELEVAGAGVRVEPGVGFQAGGEYLAGADRREGPVGAEGDMSGFGEGEQTRQRRGARGQRGIEVEPREVVQCVRHAASGLGHDAACHAERGVGHESARVAQNEPDVGVLAAYPAADQQVGRAGGIEQEVGGIRRHAVHRGTGEGVEYLPTLRTRSSANVQFPSHRNSPESGSLRSVCTRHTALAECWLL